MKRILSGLMLVVLSWTIGPAGSTEALQLQVRTYNYADVAEPDLADAEWLAARIYRQAGIELSWLPCATSQEEFVKSPDKFAGCIGATDAAIVRIQPTGFDGRNAHSHPTLAVAREDRVEIFYDRLLQFAADQNLKSTSILALVLAHELGHLLLGKDSHSPQGLMAARFRARDFRSTPDSKLIFSGWQARRMAARQGRDRLAAVHGSPRLVP